MPLSDKPVSGALQVFHRISEMLISIGSQFEPPDLLSSILTCRLWYETMLPQFWYSVDDSMYSFPRVLLLHDSDIARGDKDKAWVLAIFAKHGHLIRHLTTRTKVVIKAASLSGTCTELLLLATGSLINGLTCKEVEEQSFMEDLNRDYDESQDQAQAGPLISPLFEGIMRSGLPGARTLEHQDQDWYIGQHFWLIVYQNRSLRHLCLDASLRVLFRVTSTTFAYNMLGRLKDLERVEDGMALLQLGPLLDIAPNVRHFVASKPYIHNSTLTKLYHELLVLRLNEYVPSSHVFYYLHHLPCLDELQFSF